MSLPTHPFGSDIQIDDAFLTRMTNYFQAIQTELRAQRRTLTTVETVNVRAGNLAEGTTLRTITSTLITTTGGEIDQMLVRIDWIVRGIAELRRNAAHGESVNQLSAAEVESFLINGG